MHPIINRYQVRHPLLRNYIRFFWEINMDNADLNHVLIPQHDINIRFHLANNQQYAVVNGMEKALEPVNFAGLQDRNISTRLSMKGNVHVLGICFYPDGLFPFIRIPANELKNQLLGAEEAGLRHLHEIGERLGEQPGLSERLFFIEDQLVSILLRNSKPGETVPSVVRQLRDLTSPEQFREFLKDNALSIRSVERLFMKYIGIPANTYFKLNRFHLSMNQLLSRSYQKFSDLAFDNGYFDQMHFIHDFKRFAGKTPGNFIHQNDSILQIGRFS